MSAKLARCRCTPSHLDQQECPRYAGSIGTFEPCPWCTSRAFGLPCPKHGATWQQRRSQ